MILPWLFISEAAEQVRSNRQTSVMTTVSGGPPLQCIRLRISSATFSDFLCYMLFTVETSRSCATLEIPEPKIKFYAELRCSREESKDGTAIEFLEKAVQAAIDQVLQPEQNGLVG